MRAKIGVLAFSFPELAGHAPPYPGRSGITGSLGAPGSGSVGEGTGISTGASTGNSSGEGGWLAMGALLREQNALDAAVIRRAGRSSTWKRTEMPQAGWTEKASAGIVSDPGAA